MNHTIDKSGETDISCVRIAALGKDKSANEQ